MDSRDNNKFCELCIFMDSLKRGETVNGARDAWIKDIKMFRDDC